MKAWKDVVDYYGKENQKIVAIEELSELQKEICKDLRGMGNRENILEELADVGIMIQQIKYIYGFSQSEIFWKQEEKFERTVSRIEQEKEKT